MAEMRSGLLEMYRLIDWEDAMQKKTILRIYSLLTICMLATMSVGVEAKAKTKTHTTTHAAPEIRSTVYGQVHGINDTASGTYEWKGIPFAKPPVGALRWKAPVEPDAWTGTRDAKKFGNACIQYARIYGPGLHNTYDASIGENLNKPVGSEDCLTLNIWRPATSETNLPVIFFIYGGSNVSGYTADPVYDGANLARKANAIVVTTNYRVGVLGFLNVAQLKTGTDPYSDSGNFAILDILQALKFVNKNIASFGGDKNNVMVMGQSAGAINTWALVASPLSAGLMHKAMPMSGGLSLAANLPKGTFPTLYPAVIYAFQGNSLLEQLLIADGRATDKDSAKAFIQTQTKEQIAEYLRSKDAKVILTVLHTKLPPAMAGSGPIPDGTVLPLDPVAAIAAGNYHKIPIVASNTSEEGKLFAPFLALSPALGGKPGFLIDDAKRFKLMADFNGDIVPRSLSGNADGLNFFPFDGVPYNELLGILHHDAAAPSLAISDIVAPDYLPVDAPTTGWNARTSTLANMFFIPSRNNVLDSLSKNQPNVWYSQFRWKEEPAPWNDIYGAAHAFDLPFVFGNFGPSLFSNAMNNKANQPGREALSDVMMSSISAFIRNGDPNNSALGVKWEPWPKQLVYDATLTQKKISLEDAK
jgi:para-nitrobenzyl esterase